MVQCPAHYVFVVVDFQQEAFQSGEHSVQRILLKVADWPARVKSVVEISALRYLKISSTLLGSQNLLDVFGVGNFLSILSILYGMLTTLPDKNLIPSTVSRLNFKVNDICILRPYSDLRVCTLFWSKKIKLKRLCDFTNTTKFLPASTSANVLVSIRTLFLRVNFFEFKNSKI